MHQGCSPDPTSVTALDRLDCIYSFNSLHAPPLWTKAYRFWESPPYISLSPLGMIYPMILTSLSLQYTVVLVSFIFSSRVRLDIEIFASCASLRVRIFCTLCGLSRVLKRGILCIQQVKILRIQVQIHSLTPYIYFIRPLRRGITLCRTVETTPPVRSRSPPRPLRAPEHPYAWRRLTQR